MEKKRNLSKIITVWLACLLLVLALAVPSAAREWVELEKGCTLDLVYKYESTLFEGEEVKVYKVASFTLDGMYELTGDFAAYPVDIFNIKSQEEWNAVCDTLVAYVAADSLTPAATAKTNSDGVASFNELEVGLYLVSGVVADYIDDGTVVFADFLISVPGLDEADKWVYDVDAQPKSVYHEPVYEEVEYSVVKLWKDSSNENKRPKNIKIDILKNNKVVETVELSAQNNWSYSWKALEDGSSWLVVERNVPKDYTATFETKQTTFVVTNTYTPDQQPPTGDDFNSTPYIVAICVCGLLLIAVGVIRFSKENKEVEETEAV